MEKKLYQARARDLENAEYRHFVLTGDETGVKHNLSDQHYKKNKPLIPVSKYAELIENIVDKQFYYAESNQNLLDNVEIMPHVTHHLAVDVLREIQHWSREPQNHAQGKLNLGLVLEKYPHFENNKFLYVKPTRIVDVISAGFFPLTEAGEAIEKVKFDSGLISEIQKRQSLLKQKYENAGLCIISDSFRLQNKIAVGLGHKLVYENGFTLDPVYGIPYIPSSACKGFLRNQIIRHCFNEDENLALNNAYFTLLFGSASDSDEEIYSQKGSQGKVVFFDAYPTSGCAPELDFDTIGAIHGDFSEDLPPADWAESNPIMFISIKNTSFTFSFGLPKDVTEIKIPVYLQNDAEQDVVAVTDFLLIWLADALSQFGIGAKGAVGFGVFKHPTDVGTTS